MRMCHMLLSSMVASRLCTMLTAGQLPWYLCCCCTHASDVYACYHSLDAICMWWPRLFADGPTIDWADYEKDNYDLPAHLLTFHQVGLATDGPLAR
jgi:hypothetical protein